MTATGGYASLRHAIERLAPGAWFGVWSEGDEVLGPRTAAYLNEVDPKVILALLDEHAALTARLREAEAAIAQYEEVIQALDALDDLPTGGVLWPTNPPVGGCTAVEL